MKTRIGIASLVLFFCFATFAGAESASKSKYELNSLISDSSSVLTDIATTHENGIPEKLLQACDAIVVIPEMYKGGFVIGGSAGYGIISVRHPQKGYWSAPAFIQLIGGSIGWQIGVEKSELVLVVIGRKAVDMFLKGSFKLGADVTVAAGPVGRKGQAGVDYKFDNQIYSYSKSKGLFAGVSLEGTGIGVEDGFNETYYGQGTTAEKILIKRNVTRTGEVDNLIHTLERYIR